jgi:two-component system cell cycle sensor histidine kinase/response regulator CckA
MAKKTTIEDLEQKVEALENKLVRCKEEEKASREMEKRFKDFLDNLGDLVYEADCSGNVTYANKVCEVITGVALKNIIGKPFLPLFTKESQGVAINVYQRTLNGESPEYDLTFTNGRICHFKNEPLRDKKGEIKGVFGVARDLTEHMRAEEGLKSAYDELEKRVEERPTELAKANDQLKGEIEERKQAEEALRESKERYRILFDNAADLIVVIDTTGNFLDLNEKIEEEGGYHRQEMIGKNVFTSGILTKASTSMTLFYLKQLLAGKQWPIFEVEGVREDGGIIPYELRAVPIKKDGNIVAIQAILRNITDRKQAEKALRESEEKYRSLVELANDGIAIVQGNLIKYVNPHLAQMAGYTVDEVIDTPFVHYIHPDELSQVLDYHKRRMTGEKVPTTYTAGLRHKNGSKIDVEFNAEIITYQEKTAVFSIVRDTTERKRVEEEKKKLEVQLYQAQKAEAIGTLAGGIAHDFNNLLMAIQGNASLMLYHIDSSHPNYELLKNIEQQVKSGAKLTAQLLGYARKGKFKVKPISLNQVVTETGDTFGRARKDITIHRDLSEELFAIEADQGQMEQVLLNLFVNAADSMPVGGDLILKTMNATHKDMNGRLYKTKPGNYVQLTVTDTGTGMDKKTQERIFDPFFTTKEMGRGTGLGLASVYGIVKGHNGYIDVESRKGHGTTFSIYLPASYQKIHKLVEPASQPIEGTGTILLVDDEEMVLGVGVKMLENLGYTVLEAKGGREAIEVYNENKDEVDMVILDMIMPEMGGGEAYDRIKEINSSVKVLLSSGYSIDGQASEILKRGCDGFIQKPFSVKELSGRISEILAE